jgi:hypothetical protein
MANPGRIGVQPLSRLDEALSLLRPLGLSLAALQLVGQRFKASGRASQLILNRGSRHLSDLLELEFSLRFLGQSLSRHPSSLLLSSQRNAAGCVIVRPIISNLGISPASFQPARHAWRLPWRAGFQFVVYGGDLRDIGVLGIGFDFCLLT